MWRGYNHSVRTQLVLISALVAAGLIGGAVAIAVGGAVWGMGGTTTVVRETTVPVRARLARDPGDGQARSSRLDLLRRPPRPSSRSRRASSRRRFFGEERGEALGSGFVIDKDGHIVTNYHVIEGAEEVFVNFSQDDRLEGEGRRRRSRRRTSRCSRSTRTGARLAPSSLGNSDAVERRRPGRRDRQSVRPRPHRHGRDRERAPAPDHLAEQLPDRQDHPDGRRDQPRQLRAARS